MAISQYTKPVQPARFDPMSMQEMMMLPAALEERHINTMKMIEEMRSNEQVREQDAEDYAKIQENWNGQMNSAIDDIMKNGILVKPHTNFIMKQRQERENLYDRNKGPIGMMMRMKEEQDKEHALIDADKNYSLEEKEFFKRRNAESRGKTIGPKGQPQFTKGYMPPPHVDVEGYFDQQLKRTGVEEFLRSNKGYSIDFETRTGADGKAYPFLILTDHEGKKLQNIPQLQAALDKMSHDINSTDTPIGAYINDSPIWTAEAALKSASYLPSIARTERVTPDNTQVHPLFSTSGGGGGTPEVPSGVNVNPSRAQQFNVADKTFENKEAAQAYADNEVAKVEKEVESGAASPAKLYQKRQWKSDILRQQSLIDANFTVSHPQAAQRIQTYNEEFQRTVDEAVTNPDNKPLKDFMDGKEPITTLAEGNASIFGIVTQDRDYLRREVESLINPQNIATKLANIQSGGPIDAATINAMPTEMQDKMIGQIYKDPMGHGFNTYVRNKDGQVRAVPLNSRIIEPVLNSTKDLTESYQAALKIRDEVAKTKPFAEDFGYSLDIGTTKEESSKRVASEQFVNQLNEQLVDVAFYEDEDGKLQQIDPDSDLSKGLEQLKNLKSYKSIEDIAIEPSKFGVGTIKIAYKDEKGKHQEIYVKPKFGTGPNGYSISAVEAAISRFKSMVNGDIYAQTQFEIAIPELFYQDMPMAAEGEEVNFWDYKNDPNNPFGAYLTPSQQDAYTDKFLTAEEKQNPHLAFKGVTTYVKRGNQDVPTEVYQIEKGPDNNWVTYQDLYNYYLKLGIDSQTALQTVQSVAALDPQLGPQGAAQMGTISGDGMVQLYYGSNPISYSSKGRLYRSFGHILGLGAQ